MEAAARRNWIGVTAVLLGCLAILVAIMPRWVAPLVQAPQTVDRVAVDTATRIRDRVQAPGHGVGIQEARPRNAWPEVLAASAVFLGSFSIIGAALSFIRREPARYAVAAAALGGTAVLFQHFMLLAGLIVLALLVWAALGALGLSF